MNFTCLFANAYYKILECAITCCDTHSKCIAMIQTNTTDEKEMTLNCNQTIQHIIMLHDAIGPGPGPKRHIYIYIYT